MSLPNSYGYLNQETNDDEIKNDKQLRNNKKKLLKKETKLKLKFTEVIQKEIHKESNSKTTNSNCIERCGYHLNTNILKYRSIQS